MSNTSIPQKHSAAPDESQSGEVSFDVSHENLQLREGVNQLDRMTQLSFYFNVLGFTIIPLDKTTGKPLIEWRKYEEPQNRPTWEQTLKWFKENENGVAVILGAASDFTFCLDEDKLGLMSEVLHGNLNAMNSLIQKSPSGKYHLFLKDRACKTSIVKFVDESGWVVCELKGNGHLITLSPSLHRELHQPYTNFSSTLMVREIHDVMSLIVNRVQELGYKMSSSASTYHDEAGSISPGSLGLTDSEMSSLVSVLAQLWYRGQHHIWIVATAGWLLKLGIADGAAADFVNALCKQLGCPKRCWVNAKKQVRDIYKTAARHDAHILAFSSLLEIARTHGRKDLLDEMITLNKRLRRNNEVKTDAQLWLKGQDKGRTDDEEPRGS